VLTPALAWACSSSTIIGTSDADEPGPSSAGSESQAGAGGASSGGAGSSAGTSAFGGSTVVMPPREPDPLYPYPNTNYDEPYRGQFHFSPASGWMNDIDGLWFEDGVYHLTHQASPYALQGGHDLHWARATSSDLLHWGQQPLMLVPALNVEGEAWSGSVVVDSENTSGFQSGDAPAFVAAFTSTKLGTSLAYSNDRGQSWQAYDANPVNVGDAAYTTDRDPTVLWHEPSQQWVCVFWQDGTTFYTSPDLKTWTRASSIAFGDVVPDLYELPLNGDAGDTRWVLQAGGGDYLVGQFDGTTFVPDAQGALDLDVGPDFYAAHTFFRATFPDQRVIQIGWLQSDELQTAPWRGSATFPVELGLKTFPSGVKVTRTPIGELAQLYVSERHWDAHTLAAGKNLVSGIRSKTFDLELLIDVGGTTAGELIFRIADKTFSYDFAAQSLLGSALVALDGVLAIRLLVDWASLEIFGNDGEFSYTESFPFDPRDDSLSISADGPVTLLSADFRELARTWPGQPALRADLVDDAAQDVSYEGSWTSVSDDATFFADTCHYSQSDGAALEATFTGTRLTWYGLVNSDLGKADVFIDGGLVAAGIDCYSPTRRPAELFSIAQLASSFHTVRIVASGEKNPDSTGTALVHDYFVSAVEP
jgi:fructan beta-fructosidase